MLESEWQQCNVASRMYYRTLIEKRTRKCRLFASNCFRRLANHFPHPHLECGIELLEMIADELIDSETRKRLIEQFRRTLPEKYRQSDVTVVPDDPNLIGLMLYRALLIAPAHYALIATELLNQLEQEKFQAHLLRDIFGNPFRPVTLDPRWLTSSVLDLATSIYDERDFDRMPILADALMDAGCANDDIIQHCRGDGPHVRGCWVVDLILGKS